MQSTFLLSAVFSALPHARYGPTAHYLHMEATVRTEGICAGFLYLLKKKKKKDTPMVEILVV